MMTLGEMCVKKAIEEMERQNPPEKEDLARYFSECVRGGRKLGITKGNHCAAFASWTALQAAEEGGFNPDDLPHFPRAGARELMADAIDSRCWHQKSEVTEGIWMPAPGDLAIYDRSIPGRPETAWWGHVDRVIEVKGDKFKNIGANEVPNATGINATCIEWTYLNHPRVLGFIAYPRTQEVAPAHLLQPWEVDYIKSLVALTADQMADEARARVEADFETNWKGV